MTGEIAQMNDYMSMIFENLELDAANSAEPMWYGIYGS